MMEETLTKGYFEMTAEERKERLEALDAERHERYMRGKCDRKVCDICGRPDREA